MSRLFDYVIESMNEPKEIDMIYEENQLVMATAQDLVTVTEATYDYLLAEKEYYYGEITMEGLGESIGNAVGAAINGLKGLWEKIKKFFANIRDIILGKKKDKSDSNNSSSNSSSSSSSSSQSSSGSSSSSSPSHSGSSNSGEDHTRKAAEEKRKKDDQEKKNKKDPEEHKAPSGVRSTNDGEEKEFELIDSDTLIDLGAIHLRSNVRFLKSIIDLKEENGSEVTVMELKEKYTNDKIIKTLFSGLLSDNVNENNYVDLCKEKCTKKTKVKLNAKRCEFKINWLRNKTIEQLNAIEQELNSVFDAMIKEYDSIQDKTEQNREPIYDRKADANIQILTVKRGIITKASSYVLRYISTWRACITTTINQLETINKSF